MALNWLAITRPRRILWPLGLITLWLVSSCSHLSAPVSTTISEDPVILVNSKPSGFPEVVDEVEVSRYTGLWYEIASYPTFFNEGCVATIAVYTLRPDGQLDILNQCNTRRPNGPIQSIRGVGRVTDPRTNAKLRVRLEGNPVPAPYWIIDLDQVDYQYAVVSDPFRSTLFILSRQPTLSSALFEGILFRLQQQGYDLQRLSVTRQPRR